MESILGRGYSINEETDLIEQYSPLSSTIDEDLEQDDDLFYTEGEHVQVRNEDEEQEEDDDNSSTVPNSNGTLSTTSIDELSGMNLSAFKPPALKLMPVEATPPPTPLVPRRLLDPLTSATNDFQKMTINTNLPLTPPRNAVDLNNTNWSLGTTNSTSDLRNNLNNINTPMINNNNNNSLFSRPSDTTPKTATSANLLTPTSIDRFFTGHRRLSDSNFISSTTLDHPLAISTTTTTSSRNTSTSIQNNELANESNHLYSYMDQIVEGNLGTNGTPSTTTSWSTLISSNSANNDDLLSFSSLSRTRINSSSYAPSTPQLNFKPLQQSSPLQVQPQSMHLPASPYPQRLNSASAIFQPSSNTTPSSNGPFSHSSAFHPQSPVTHQNQHLLSLSQQTQRPLWQQQQQQQQPPPPPPPMPQSSIASQQSSQPPQQHRPLLPIGMSPMPPPPPPQSLQQQQQSQSAMNQLQNNDAWLLAEMTAMLRQNQQQQMTAFNTNITLSSAAQQILAASSNNNNNRPLRSEKIDIEIIKHLIREARWKRRCGMKKEVCVFCRNNGENELIYTSHSLKDSVGNVTCPILRAYQCPICGATGAQAHTIKYCQAAGDDSNRHVATPYEKMIRTQCMQTFGLDDNLTTSMPALFGPIGSNSPGGSPASLWPAALTGAWPGSNL